jgi:hypothetical protein
MVVSRCKMPLYESPSPRRRKKRLKFLGCFLSGFESSLLATLHPGQACFLERVGTNHAKDSADGIVGRNAVPELDELLEPQKPNLGK